MPGEDRKLDPITRDYVDAGDGSWAVITTAQTALHHQLLGELNAWAGDPEAGSELHLLVRKGKNDRITAQEAGDIVKRAFRPFLEEGRISNLKVELDQDPLGRFVLVITCRDVQAGGAVELALPIAYGA